MAMFDARSGLPTALRRRPRHRQSAARWPWMLLPALLFCGFLAAAFCPPGTNWHDTRSQHAAQRLLDRNQPAAIFAKSGEYRPAIAGGHADDLSNRGNSGLFSGAPALCGRGTLLALLTFPLAFPGVVVGFLVVMLAGRQGVLAQLSLGLFHERWTLAYSLSGLFMGYLYFSLPRAIVTLIAASEKLDRSLEEAARSLGASQWRIVWDVIVPGLKPALLSSGALCFATSMGAFGTAFTLGTDLNVLPLTIYGEFTNYANFATAAALSVVMGGVAWLGLMLTRMLTHTKEENS